MALNPILSSVIPSGQLVTSVAAPPIGLVTRASPPLNAVLDQLGPLANLPGTWIGKGFNLVALPVKPPGIFRIKVDATIETLSFTATGAPIPNRAGAGGEDIKFLGLHYFQQIVTAVDTTGLHLETGMWLNLPESEKPLQISRMSTIPHGDALLAQGTSAPSIGPPIILPVDVIPFTIDPHTGTRQNDTNPQYLAPYHTTPVPPGLPVGCILDPNLVLVEALKGKKVVKTTTLEVSATPVGGINNTPVHSPSPIGGIVNIPFVTRNANANSLAAFFWIEEIDDGSGETFLQLQYSQTTILEFAGLKWPHVSVATLLRQ